MSKPGQFAVGFNPETRRHYIVTCMTANDFKYFPSRKAAINYILGELSRKSMQIKNDIASWENQLRYER